MTGTDAVTETEPTAPLYRQATERRVLAVHGPEAADFLQGLLTNDVLQAGPDRLVYAALLTPQGKFLAEMILARPAPDRFLLDIDGATAAGVVQRLGMYKLRAAVTLEPLREGSVWQLWGPGADAVPTRGGAPDPRAASLGRRFILETRAAAEAVEAACRAAGARTAEASDWRRAMIAARAPLSGEDLVPNDCFPLELDFERLRGVDFRKGCYVGQEVTARMKHKATLKKGLARLAIDGPAPPPGAALTKDGKPVGRMGAAEGAAGLALLRLDRVAVGEALDAEDATLTVTELPG